jgi:hypothetical protein
MAKEELRRKVVLLLSLLTHSPCSLLTQEPHGQRGIETSRLHRRPVVEGSSWLADKVMNQRLSVDHVALAS